MTRITFLLATLVVVSLAVAPRVGLAQQESAADETTGSIADTLDQPTPGQIRRLRDERMQGESALPPPEAIAPEIDLLAPAPDAFQEP